MMQRDFIAVTSLTLSLNFSGPIQFSYHNFLIMKIFPFLSEMESRELFPWNFSDFDFSTLLEWTWAFKQPTCTSRMAIDYFSMD